MLKFLKPFQLLACAALLFVAASCSDDEKSLNRLIVDGVKYPLGHGYIRDNGTDIDNDGVEGSLHEVVFTTKKLTVGEFGDLNGSGHQIRFQFFSENLENLQDGTYTYQIEGYDVGGLNYSEGTMSYSQSNEYDLYVGGGSATVTKSGSTYKVTWTMTMFTDGRAGGDELVDVSGRFEGRLTEFFYNEV
jgi:hypothetical protein